ncbi:hypothetical protein GEMRC1_003705 [Eukaryota sp. GEM-RC1]
MLLFQELLNVFFLRYYCASHSSFCPESLLSTLKFHYEQLSSTLVRPSLEVITSAHNLLSIHVCEYCFSPISSDSPSFSCSLCPHTLYCCNSHRQTHRSSHYFLCSSLSNLSFTSPSAIYESNLTTSSTSNLPDSPHAESLQTWVQTVQRRIVSSPSKNEDKQLPTFSNEDDLRDKLKKSIQFNEELQRKFDSITNQSDLDLNYLKQLVIKKDTQIESLLAENRLLKTSADEADWLKNLIEPDFVSKYKQEQEQYSKLQQNFQEIQGEMVKTREELTKSQKDCRALRFELSSVTKKFEAEIKETRNRLIFTSRCLEQSQLTLFDRDVGKPPKLFFEKCCGTESLSKSFEASSQTNILNYFENSCQTTNLVVNQSVSTIKVKYVNREVDCMSVKIKNQSVQTVPPKKPKEILNIGKKLQSRDFFQPSRLLTNVESSLIAVRQLVPPTSTQNLNILQLFDICFSKTSDLRTQKSLEAWKIMITRSKYVCRAAAIAEKLATCTEFEKSKFLTYLSKVTTQWQKELADWKINRQEQSRAIFDSAKITLLTLLDDEGVSLIRSLDYLNGVNFDTTCLDVESIAANIDILAPSITFNFTEMTDNQRKKKYCFNY